MTLLKKAQQFILLFIVLVAAIDCDKKSLQNTAPSTQILAIVGPDTIYVNDFIRRSEFTIRPPYCQKNSIQDKRIILNSLIAEKLFALDVAADSALLCNDRLQARLTGIKEQAMREELVRKMVVDKTDVPQHEIQQAYLNSKKTVYIESIHIPAQCNLGRIYQDALNGTSLEEIAIKYAGVSPKATQEVKWGHVDQEIQNAIFNNAVKKGTVLAPIRMENGARLIKVTGWSEEIELSEANRKLQLQNIEKSLKDYYLRENYQAFAKEVMKGKRIDFFESGWNVVVQTLLPVYLHKAKTPAFSQNELPQPEDDFLQIQQNSHLPFMSVNGTVWKLSDFYKAVLKHPLAIDATSLTKENFPLRLQAAVAGLVTDINLTEHAFKEKMDRCYSVRRAVSDWESFYRFLYIRDQYLQKRGCRGSITKDYFEIFNNYLQPYVDSLKTKYDSAIFYNPQALDSLNLTSVPMVAYKTNGPYTQVVPPFPLVTNSVKCNYKRLQ